MEPTTIIIVFLGGLLGATISISLNIKSAREYLEEIRDLLENKER